MFPNPRLALAELYLNTGEEAKAEECYRRAIALDALFVPARVNLAEFLYTRGRLEESEPILREGVLLRPNDGYAHEAWGRFEIRRKHYEEGGGLAAQGGGTDAGSRGSSLLHRRGIPFVGTV